MLKNWKLFLTLFLALILSGCASLENSTQQAIDKAQVKQTTQAKYIPTNPASIYLTEDKTIDTHYSIIGTIKVARRNFVGIKRQKADINDLMQAHAASIGGNAVIDIHKDGDNMAGQIIKYTT